MSKSKLKSKKSQEIPKAVLYTAQFLDTISTRLAVVFAAKLFTTPIKHKMPKREFEMNKKTIQTPFHVPEINKDIVVYEWGNHTPKVLLVHGWSGRGTQLYKIAEALVNNGYSVVSFDAPGHGKSAGNSSIMLEFIASIKAIDQKFGPFEAAVGHSLGGMALFNAVKDGFKIKNLVTIGSGDVVKDIIHEFVSKLKIKKKAIELLSQHFEKKYKVPMNSFSAYLSAEKMNIPVLVIHDEDDDDVPVSAGIHIHKHLKNGSLMITQKLGHRKILGDEKVIQRTIEFIQNKK
ncbi:alpha/beta hydrolase [Flavobacterium sp.]|uniref:alpha/beta hydrolase n=1 Tax=Flavobacterium sp. TaxID=239 RepID=UPI002606A06C|nr:alpha/beta hydrolase [Flavobacterium sp.]MDD3004623.1 alpha/beta hydrolase [Flavobacterium sp.]